MSLLPQFPTGTRRRFLYATIAILVMITVGSIGFHLLEGFTWNESIYVATQTVTTVGYGDLTPKTMRGQLFCNCFYAVRCRHSFIRLYYHCPGGYSIATY